MSGATTAASIVSVGSQVAGTAISASGSYYGAKSQKGNLESQAKMAEINARIAEMGAQSALEQGKHQVASLTMQAGQLKGKQRTTMAANGIDLGVGNAAEVQASTELMKTVDMGTLKMNALRTAFGYRTQGMNAKNEAAMARANSSSVSPGGAAFSTLLGGASQVASSWYGMSQAGVFDSPKYDSIDALAADKGFW